ncbi:hypothetical protein [Nocardia nova]|uniref:hypothetical protein n=1 Tax=Nocardia nova TaxID=37330 RepID=UPI0011DDA19F|nr:hypothetical protein [Nocardia nova]
MDRERMQHHAALVRLMSITEAFAVDLLAESVEAWASSAEVEVQTVWRTTVESALMSWPKIKEAYAKWLKAGPPVINWDPVLGFVEARNAVAHGLGNLTRLQRKNRSKTISTLGHGKIKLDAADAVELDEVVLKRAADECRMFIETLDAVVQFAPLSSG